LTYTHGGGECSITGGYVVRDARLAGWTGRYLYGDLCQGRVRSVLLRPGRAVAPRATGLHVPVLSSFGEDGLGRLYVVSLDGPVYRIVAR
jgi:hypothetical protein